MQYNSLVERHFNAPENPVTAPCPACVTGRGGSVAHGTWIEFQLELDGDEIDAARFRAYGCPHTIALASWLTTELRGMTLTADFALDKKRIVEEFELPAEKMAIVLVAEDALRDCAANAKN